MARKSGRWGTAAGLTGSFGGSSSGSATTVSSTIRYGLLSLSFTFNLDGAGGTLQGRSITVPSGTNVWLVDVVDDPAGPVLAGSVTLNPGGTTQVGSLMQSLAPLYRLSPQIVSFLRCDVPLPQDPFGFGFTGACAELGR